MKYKIAQKIALTFMRREKSAKMHANMSKMGKIVLKLDKIAQNCAILQKSENCAKIAQNCAKLRSAISPPPLQTGLSKSLSETGD